MGLSFKCEETKKIWLGEHSKKLPSNIQAVAKRKLRMLNNVLVITELHKIPGNRIEKLKGNRKGQYSIRINDQWRICFKWIKNDAKDVAIEDYH